MDIKTVRVLLMDPDERLRNQISSNLKKSGNIFVGVPNSDKMLKILEDDAFNIVIADMDSIEGDVGYFVSSVKQIKPDICFVAATSNLSAVNAGELIKAGVDNIVAKPLNPEEILFTIAFSIEKFSAIVQNSKNLRKIEDSLRSYKVEIDRAQEVLEQNFIDTVKTFIGLLEYRDQNLGTHCKRVATFTRAICEQYDLKDRIKKEIEIGALLHDIGKIGLSDLILLKTRDFFSRPQMTNREISTYQKHPVIGQEAIQMINTMSNVGVYVKHHHERFNGSGYPDGLKGYLIPLGARIINVIDAYDRIVFGVDKLKQKDAEVLFLKYLQKHKGDSFDPEVTENVIEFIKVIKSKEYSSEKRITIENLLPDMILARDVYSKSGVLLISQYERINGNDVERLNRFLNSEMIIDNIYIYESTVTSVIKSGNKAIKKNVDYSKLDTEKDNHTINEFIESVKELETIPEIRDAINRNILDAKSTMDDMSNIIKADPVTALKLLRMANSPIFSFTGEVDNIEDAAAMLGYNEVRRIVASLPVMDEKKDDQTYFNHRKFWKHMLGCAVVSRIIGRSLSAKNSDLYFTAGLFHDIGKLIFHQFSHDKFMKVIFTANRDSVFYRKAERNIFGQTHEEIGHLLLEKWNIPTNIRDAVKNHHSPMDSTVDPLLTSAVHYADIVAHMLHIGESGEKTVPKLESFAEKKLGISLSNLELYIPEIDEDLKLFEKNLFGE